VLHKKDLRWVPRFKPQYGIGIPEMLAIPTAAALLSMERLTCLAVASAVEISAMIAMVSTSLG
jgi:hypothetical protein